MADNDRLVGQKQPEIAGHKPLSAAQIGCMNQIKHYGNDIRKLFEQLEKEYDCDPRWIEIARNQMQLGFMALTRAVAKNEFF